MLMSLLQHLLVMTSLKKKNQHQSIIKMFLPIMLCCLLHLQQLILTFFSNSPQNAQLEHASTIVPSNYYQNNQLQHASSNTIQGHNYQNRNGPSFAITSIFNPCNHQINVLNQHLQNIAYGLIRDSMGCSKEEDSEEITKKKMNKMMNVMIMGIMSKILEKL